MAVSAYRLTNGPEVVRTADGAVIPNDPLNADRVEYEAWLAVPNVPDPFIPPVITPHVDANERLDAGISAAIGAAEAVRDGIHNIPNNFNAVNFQAFLTQAKVLSDAFVAMLEAQQGPPPP
jgi:hypothetical protein